MSLHSIREIIGTAIIDQAFCHTLVAGDRATLLATYDLLPIERQMLLDIQADSLTTFAQQVYDWARVAHQEEPTTSGPVQAGTPAQRKPAVYIHHRPAD